ncbi:MAG: hypothetical protein GC202_01225 [Alphaproteobacteria bacterium]|nr:hypothetical protein [Alphaproteobacteria bacterium]
MATQTAVSRYGTGELRGGAATVGAVALVAFTDRTEIAWLRGLRRGFRHCAIWVRAGDFWIAHEALSHQCYVGVLAAVDTRQLRAGLRAAGYRVVKARIAAAPRRLAPVLPLTCVEGVKRLLGIHSWRILTPWQLYRYLIRRHRNLHLTNNLNRNI